MDKERQQLKALIGAPQWSAFEQLADRVCKKIQEEKVSHNTEWETLRALLVSEGQEKGIRRLLQELYRQVGEV